MLFSEVATIARDANVKELWLTHFSPSHLTQRTTLKMPPSLVIQL